MIVAFCGHRELFDPPAVKAWLSQVVAAMIEEGAEEFWFGDKGAFDQAALRAVSEKKNALPHLRRTLVKAYLNQAYDPEKFDETMYPPLENAPYRLAMVRRNEYMAMKCDVLVTYAIHNQGNAMRIREFARRKGKRVINYPDLP